MNHEPRLHHSGRGLPEMVKKQRQTTQLTCLPYTMKRSTEICRCYLFPIASGRKKEVCRSTLSKASDRPGFRKIRHTSYEYRKTLPVYYFEVLANPWLIKQHTPS
jgi:hypothetical protein